MTSTINAATLSVGRVPPGACFKLFLNWDAQPLERDDAVFVHFNKVSSGAMAANLQGDHYPPVPTSQWIGPVRYQRTIRVPASAPAGTYNIYAGLFYELSPGEFVNEPLTAGPGVTADAENRYLIGRLVIDKAAPMPLSDDKGRPSLDLSGFALTLDEPFDVLCMVSASSSAVSRWYASEGPAFGEAVNVAPGSPDNPYSISQGVLSIRARKRPSGWKSGLFSSLNERGEGFAQKYGYFEMRGRLPTGPGTWPAFWLVSQSAIMNPSEPFCEIDILEQWSNPTQKNDLYSTVHHWIPSRDEDVSYADFGNVPTMATTMHNYGCMVTPDNIIFYIDGCELWRMATPEIARAPLYVIVDLALGGDGNPIGATPSPQIMDVQHVKVWQNPAFEA